MQEMTRILIFVHMPKAAGSTLQSIVDKQFPHEATYTIQGDSIESVQHSIEHLRQMPIEEKRRLQCIKGHMPFGLHRWLPQGPFYTTMLRDPVERMVSDYYFARNTPHHSLHDKVVRKQMSLADFATMRAEDGLTNLYTRVLSGSVNWSNLVELPFPLPNDVLDIARMNLEEYFAVTGITEKFDESILLMKDAYGWSDTYYERSNMTREKPTHYTIDSTTLDMIRRYNHDDIELYNFAVDTLEKRITQGGQDFRRRLEKFRKENLAYQSRLKIHRLVKRLRDYFLWSQPISGGGASAPR